jgi:biopolymer transport protein ExbB
VEPAQTLGFANFLSQTDGVGKIVVFLLMVMSVATWYLIFSKAMHILQIRRRSGRFLSAFWNAPSLAAVALDLANKHPDDPFSNLAWHGLAAARHHARQDANTRTGLEPSISESFDNANSTADFLTRSMRRVIDEDTAQMESGLTVLASIGSTAPFVGLFGTVWGVYHALVAIGLSGQGTLDKVAGPVGEALIMTALGLAVAVPAVLAYNALVRHNRVTLARLDSFAHDLFSLLTTGSHVNALSADAPRKAAPTTAIATG